MKVSRQVILWTIVAGLLLAGCPGEHDNGGHEGESHDEHGAEVGHDEHGAEVGHDEHADDGRVVELSPEAVERIGLTTAAAAEVMLAAQRVTTGEVGFDEERLAHVAPRVGGRLLRVPASLGATVAKSEILAVVDSMEMGRAKAAFLRARARHEVAARHHERERDLHAERIVSEQQVLEAEAAAREAAADLATHREDLRLLGLTAEAIAALHWDHAESSQVSVRAPFAGKIVERDATLGELVAVDDVLFTLADLSEVWLWIDLYERDLAHVGVGEPVEVRFDAWPNEVVSGEISYLGDHLDAGSRTVRARVDLPNPTRRLKPGMFARVKLATSGEQPSAALAVPRKAVQRDDEASIVFVETATGRFERRDVEVGRVTDDLVEILHGVDLGERVVTQGSFLLKSQAAGDEIGGHHH